MGGQKKSEQERIDAILAAAYQIAVAEGLEAVTARRVATAAGISPGLVFFHFQSKDTLLQALLNVLLDGTLDALTDPGLAELAPWDRLDRMVRGELERLREYHSGVELLFGFYFARRDDHFRPRIEASFGRYLEAFLPVCREAVAENGSSGAVSGDDLAATVVALVQGASVQAVRDPQGFRTEPLLAALRALRPAG
jgi:TetR/AcrR family transcriptional repressor of bet genes